MRGIACHPGDALGWHWMAGCKAAQAMGGKGEVDVGKWKSRGSGTQFPTSNSTILVTTRQRARPTVPPHPHVGGATIIEGGSPGFTLSAGYIGSMLLGGTFMLAGWDTLVAKIMSFVLGVGLVLPLVLVRDKL
ncbi:hypothetical protein BJ912DRAFT_1043686 [Pholiota molesta]|nr:hypothetical protein BJ912DRAFT_1043686 [Pholiota molesta]